MLALDGWSFVVLLTLLNTCSAANWMIDTFCTPDEQAFIVDGMARAQRMAATANTVLARRPLDAEVQKVVDNLFDPAINPGVAINFAPVVLGGISRWNNRVYSNADLARDDLKFYCRERYTKRDDGNYVDDDTKEVKAEKPCGAFDLMATDQVYRNDWWQIQICPRFLSIALPASYKWTTGLAHLTFWKKVSLTAVQKLFAMTLYTPVDALSLFEKVLVHEFTHANYQVRTDDVGYKSGYGWKNCQKIGKQVTAGSPGDCVTPHDENQKPLGPECNADTWALLASICWQLEDGDITGVNTDGTYNKP